MRGGSASGCAGRDPVSRGDRGAAPTNDDDPPHLSVGRVVAVVPPGAQAVLVCSWCGRYVRAARGPVGRAASLRLPDRGQVRCAQAAGMRTPSIRYTVALAVVTPPQITLAPLTVSASGSPAISTVPPWTVVWVLPARSSGVICPGTTW